MANYVANCKISGPVDLGVSADVDFNGMQWSYRYGLIFPRQAAAQNVPIILPAPAAAVYVPRTPSP